MIWFCGCPTMCVLPLSLCVSFSLGFSLYPWHLYGPLCTHISCHVSNPGPCLRFSLSTVTVDPGDSWHSGPLHIISSSHVAWDVTSCIENTLIWATEAAGILSNHAFITVPYIQNGSLQYVSKGDWGEVRNNTWGLVRGEDTGIWFQEVDWGQTEDRNWTAHLS